MPRDDETSRAILFLLSEGRSVEEILREHPELTPDDVASAAADGLHALETYGQPRVETRAERVARQRLAHPRAYEPWTEEEDARLLLRWEEGARVAELARALGRQPGAVRARLEKWLGPGWRERRRA